MIPSVLEKALENSICNRERRTEVEIERVCSAREILEEITATLKTSLQGQYISKRSKFLKNSGKDLATITTETIRIFDSKWNHLDARVKIIPGKKVVKMLREKVQELYSVSLTDIRIIDEFSLSEIPDDMISLIKDLEGFRAGICS